MQKTHEYRCTVMPWHIDYNGHLNNASYLTLLEYARTEWSYRTHMFQRAMKKNIAFALAGTNIMFRKEARLMKRVVIETRWVGNDQKFIYVEQVIRTDDKKKEFISRAILRIMGFNPKERKLVTASDFVYHLMDSVNDREEAQRIHEEYVERAKQDTRVKSFIESHEWLKEDAKEIIGKNL